MTDRNRELEGKVAIVTGSARNIGQATAEELARAGAAVTINAVNDKDACEAVADGINTAGGKAIAVMADITKQDDVDRLVKETADAFGGIDILINNAATRTKRNFTELDFEEWEKLRNVALDGAFRM
jgi:NAD(P)-dependent dehydrogenase (short-subunit alcohol dehydrogenase family)